MSSGTCWATKCCARCPRSFISNCARLTWCAATAARNSPSCSRKPIPSTPGCGGEAAARLVETWQFPGVPRRSPSAPEPRTFPITAPRAMNWSRRPTRPLRGQTGGTQPRLPGAGSAGQHCGILKKPLEPRPTARYPARLPAFRAASSAFRSAAFPPVLQLFLNLRLVLLPQLLQLLEHLPLLLPHGLALVLQRLSGGLPRPASVAAGVRPAGSSELASLRWCRRPTPRHQNFPRSPRRTRCAGVRSASGSALSCRGSYPRSRCSLFANAVPG